MAAKSRRVLLTGGGTGGHVYPTLAIYELLRREELVGEALYLGVRGRAEERIVPGFGIDLRFIPSAPFAESSLLAKFLAILVIVRGSLAAAAHLLRFRPGLVIAAGGYVSAPVILAAFLLKPLLRLRIVVDEQNLVPGLLNKFASLFADVVLVSFKETAYFIWNNRCVVTGYPVRAPYLGPLADRAAAKRALSLPEDRFVVLVSGGSLGARSVNRAVAEIAPRIAEETDILLVHAIGMTRGAGYDAVQDTQARLREALGDRFDPETLSARSGDSVFYLGFRYLENHVDFQKAADLVVSRAGAGSLAETLALGKSAILVPKRGLPGDHQEMNAMSVAEQGGAEVLFERRDEETGVDWLRADLLFEMIQELARDPQRRLALEERARSLATLDVEERVVATIRRLLEGRQLDFAPQVSEPRSVRFQRSFDSLIAFLDRGYGQQGREHELYRRFYSIKLDEYLTSDDFLVVNKGIKLIGALRKTSRYGFLRDNFASFVGYQKRNALTALSKAERAEPFFGELILAGLRDRYYEVRAEAIRLYRTFAADFRGDPEIEQRILTLLRRRSESWEVRAEAIKATAFFLDEPSFLAGLHPFRASRNVRAREAVLEAIQLRLKDRGFEDLSRLRRFVKSMLVTTSEFTPQFRVRSRYVHVVELLERLR